METNMNSLSIEDLKILIADLLITMRCLELEKAKLQAKLDNMQRMERNPDN